MRDENIPITTMDDLLAALWVGLDNHRKTGARVRFLGNDEITVIQDFDDGRGHSNCMSTARRPLDAVIFREAVDKDYISGVLEPGYVSKTDFTMTEHGKKLYLEEAQRANEAARAELQRQELANFTLSSPPGTVS